MSDVSELIHLLADVDGDVRSAAARGLGRLKARAAVPVLVEVLRRDREADRDAAMALGEIGDPAAVLPLCAAIEADPAGAGWCYAAALARFGDVRAVETLRWALKQPDRHLRYYAALGLGAIKDQRAAEALVAALGHRDERVARAAAEGLVRIGPMAVEPLLLELGRPVQRHLGQIAQALGQIGDRRATGPLIARLAEPGDREAIAAALAGIGSPAVRPLAQELETGAAPMRTGATLALARIGTRATVGPLVVALADPAEPVRKAAEVGLAGMGRQAVPMLELALAGSDPAARAAAARALGAIGARRSFRPLCRALADVDANVRGSAVDALGALGAPGGLRPLLAAAETERSTPEIDFPRALAKLGPRSLPALLRGARSRRRSLRVRGVCARAAGMIGDARALQPLIALLRDADPGVSEAAAEALGSLNRALKTPPGICPSCSSRLNFSEEILDYGVRVSRFIGKGEDIDCLVRYEARCPNPACGYRHVEIEAEWRYFCD